MTPHRLTLLALGAALVGGLARCSTSTPGADVTAPPGGGNGSTVFPGDPSGFAHVRVVDVVSDAAQGVDVGLNGAPALNALQYAEVFPYTQGQYQSVPAASKIAFTATGAATPFYDQAPSALAANSYATLIAFGRVSSAGLTAARAVALSDTNFAPQSGALIRFFNTVDYLAAGVASPVDIYVYPQGAARPATPDVVGLPWGERSAYLARAAGTLQIDVFPARAASTGTPLFTGTAPTITGSLRTVVLYDPPAGSPAATTGGVLVLQDFN